MPLLSLGPLTFNGVFLWLRSKLSYFENHSGGQRFPRSFKVTYFQTGKSACCVFLTCAGNVFALFQFFFRSPRWPEEGGLRLLCLR